MLKAKQFSVGTLADVKSLTLITPRTKYETTILVAPDADKLNAVFIGEYHRFHTFECSGNSHFSGLLITGIDIEVDPSSVFDSRSNYAPLGALVRSADRLSIAANAQERFGRITLIPVSTDLVTCSAEHEAGFCKWQIVIGEGAERQVLLKMDVTTA